MREVEISIVVGTWNRPSAFRRLVSSVSRRTPFEWEIVCSDCSDAPFCDQDFEQEYGEGRIRILQEVPKKTMVYGYNRAFRAARGNWVVWLNDDAEVMEGWAKAAVDFMKQYPEIGVGALYYAEARPPWRVNQYKGTVYANFGIISKSLGDQIGWIDDELIMYGMDNSICFKALLAGKGVVGIPGSRIWHHVVQDDQKVDNQKHRVPDAAKLMEKYRDQIPRIITVFQRYAYLQEKLEYED